MTEKHRAPFCSLCLYKIPKNTILPWILRVCVCLCVCEWVCICDYSYETDRWLCRIFVSYVAIAATRGKTFCLRRGYIIENPYHPLCFPFSLLFSLCLPLLVAKTSWTRDSKDTFSLFIPFFSTVFSLLPRGDTTRDAVEKIESPAKSFLPSA